MMKNDKKMTVSWRETFSLNLRAIRTFYQLYPQMILSRIFYSLGQALTPYVGIWFSAQLLSELAGNKNPERLTKLVLLALGSTALTMLINALLDHWRNTANNGMLFKRDMPFVLKMLSMDYQDVDDTKSRELLQKIKQSFVGGGWGLFRLTWTVENFVTAVSSILAGLGLSVTLFTSCVPETMSTYTFLNHPMFLVLILASMIGIACLASYMMAKSDHYWLECSDKVSLGERMEDFYCSGFCNSPKCAADIRIYRQERFAVRYFGNKETAFCSKGFWSKLSRGPMGLCWAGGSAISAAFAGVSYTYVCLKALAGAFGIGAVTQYVAALTKVATGISNLLRELTDMRNNAPFLKTTFEFLDIPNRMYQGTLPVEKRDDHEYEFAFHNVSFKYPGSEQYVLKNVSFRFKIGSRLAVVGMNGSGKTTFIKLLCRLYDPTEGEITLNGIDIRKYRYDEYMSLFSVVFQDFRLFGFSLGQNVSAGADADKARAEDCLRKAGFGKRLDSLSKGIDTPLYKHFDDDGIELSGGEEQKVALARALYKNAHIVILDEPTASLDPIAEAEIYAKFNDIVGSKTAIYISHRLSSCRFCDEILVFDHGEVIQQGSHEALVVQAGKYRELWNAQAQYYV